jgi:hypothetical protein
MKGFLGQDAKLCKSDHRCTQYFYVDETLLNVLERRYGNTGCRRTYLSGRDLQAHIQHRHHKNNKDDEK